MFVLLFCHGKLTIVKVVVEAVLFKHLFVRALLDDMTLVHNKNDVRFTDRRKSVSNNKARPALHHSGKGFLNSNLGVAVD